MASPWLRNIDVELAFTREVEVNSDSCAPQRRCSSLLIDHLICGRRADRPTFRDSHELLAKALEGTLE